MKRRAEPTVAPLGVRVPDWHLIEAAAVAAYPRCLICHHPAERAFPMVSIATVLRGRGKYRVATLCRWCYKAVVLLPDGRHRPDAAVRRLISSRAAGH